eukprot:6668259-Lingulodinium_polyedra.AAC.1
MAGYELPDHPPDFSCRRFYGYAEVPSPSSCVVLGLRTGHLEQQRRRICAAAFWAPANTSTLVSSSICT